MGEGRAPRTQAETVTLTLDTSAVIALADDRDPDHEATAGALDADRGPYVVPAGILAEAAYMLETRVGHEAVSAFLADLVDHRLLLHCGEDDFRRVGELVVRYRDLPLGFADAAVIACAEQRGGRVLSVDRRDFDVVAGELPLEVLP